MLKRGLDFLMLLVPLLGAACANAAEPGVPVSGKTLLDELRRGGYIVYFRHTKTLPEHAHEAQMRRDGKWRLEDCSTQRNLSEAGYYEARMQRDMVSKLGIPYAQVYSSAACRTRIHADWVVQHFEFLDALTPPRSREKGLIVRRLLNTPPAPGTNTFLFAHGGILWSATDYDSLESETFVFRPSPDGKPPGLIAAIRIEDWEKLARGEPCCAPRNYWRGQGEPPVD
ncbi:MAG: hypothetical protein K2X06_18025 [Burkholderiales bacterium]|nr:hypothetical protein [Burkholderiales bacterium]